MLMAWHDLAPLRQQLERHPLYASIRSPADLRVFMSHHIYSVWDFMSLVKTMQAVAAPVVVPWRPMGDAGARRLINQIVLEEESDLGPPAADGSETYLSHFELYCGAMREVGADPGPALQFLDLVGAQGIDAALRLGRIPEPARRFMQTTFGIIAEGKPHTVAAALALGREHLIPMMFRGLLRDFGIGADVAPLFHFYLQRHIHLDEDLHGPLSLRLLDHLCGDDVQRITAADTAARTALQARLAFWDGVAQAMPGSTP